MRDSPKLICETCVGAGWCAAHEIWKHAHWTHLCRTDPRYRAAYDEGRGPGQAVATIGTRVPIDPAKAAAVRREFFTRALQRRWIEARHRPWAEVEQILAICTERGCWPGGCSRPLDAWAADVLRPGRWRDEWGPYPVSGF
jgi:hypothetical protein